MTEQPEIPYWRYHIMHKEDLCHLAAPFVRNFAPGTKFLQRSARFLDMSSVTATESCLVGADDSIYSSGNIKSTSKLLFLLC